MIQVYPYSNPLILTDDLFIQYGGQTGAFSSAQRSAAYLIAEKQATNFLGTFLLPTVITGTWANASRIVTDYGYVQQILSVNILSRDLYLDCNLQSSIACAYIWDDTYGYLDINQLFAICNCKMILLPYQVQVAYQAGLPTGIATQPDVLLALTMAATISLNEMIFPSQNEGAGDVGIEEFASLDYREKRKSLLNTEFGNSARANKIAQLLKGAVRPARPALMLR